MDMGCVELWRFMQKKGPTSKKAVRIRTQSTVRATTLLVCSIQSLTFSSRVGHVPSFILFTHFINKLPFID